MGLGIDVGVPRGAAAPLLVEHRVHEVVEFGFGVCDPVPVLPPERVFFAVVVRKHPRVRMHFTPTSGSWLNLVEVFFGIITRQAIRRGTFTSVKDLIGAIETFIDAWNDRCQPFVWTKTADEILTKANRKVTSNTRH